MPKVVRGRAGREQKREDVLDSYVESLVPMLLKQVRPGPHVHMMHLGNPGAVQLAEAFASMLVTGELVVMVYTYDDMQEARAALAGLGNVQVINELEDIDPDEPPYQLMTSIVPFNLGRDYVNKMLLNAIKLLATDGLLYIAGDKQLGFDRHLEALTAARSRITPVVQVGSLRIVTASKPGPTGGLRPVSTTA